ncbi:MAG: ParB/RepB/Spo0J family partition protein [Cytophagales bacterium]|nr:MAG: ParB/RepB/Spo0J family partition protein [Cytophagales bacterium]
MSNNSGTKRNALGRGLSALLKDNDTVNQSSAENKINTDAPLNYINDILIDNIEVNPFQPRTHFDQEALHELADSIKTQGIIQPITVRQLSKDKYQLISGERRYQASKIAGLTVIPAYIRTANDQQMLEMALIENIQRENLNALEVAISYQRMITECNLKQEELGDRVGKNRSTVNNYLRLLKLPPDIQAALRDEEISMGHARALIGIDNIALQLSIFKQLIEQELSVRKLEELVREATEGKEKNKSLKSSISKNKDPEINHVQQKLTSFFGTKIQIKADDKNKGEIKIPFMSTEDLNRILELINI